MQATYTLPGDTDCHNNLAAQAARWAWYVRAHKEQEAKLAAGTITDRTWHLIAKCEGCGMNTGNTCEVCVSQKRVYTAYNGQMVSGSPLCSRCEDNEHVACPVCGTK